MLWPFANLCGNRGKLQLKSELFKCNATNHNNSTHNTNKTKTKPKPKPKIYDFILNVIFNFNSLILCEINVFNDIDRTITQRELLNTISNNIIYLPNTFF